MPEMAKIENEPKATTEHGGLKNYQSNVSNPTSNGPEFALRPRRIIINL